MTSADGCAQAAGNSRSGGASVDGWSQRGQAWLHARADAHMNGGLGQGFGGGLRQKTLHFFWLVDCSGSMAQDDFSKISSLNNAVRESLPVLRDVAAENSVRVLMRALSFSTGCRWHIPTPTPVNEVRWNDLNAEGRTDLGAALTELAEEMRLLERESTSGSHVPPAIVLVSDGHPTDEFGAGLKALTSTEWGAKAARIAVAIGDDAHHETLSRFMGTDEIPVLGANQPEAIADLLKWASTVAVSRASTPPPTTGTTGPPPQPPGGLGGQIFRLPAGGTQPPALVGTQPPPPPPPPGRSGGGTQPPLFPGGAGTQPPPPRRGLFGRS